MGLGGPIRGGCLGPLQRQRRQPVSGGRRHRRAGLQMLVPVAQDPLQARAGPAVPRRGRWCPDRRTARLGTVLAGRAGQAELPPPRPGQNGRPRSTPKRAPNGSRRASERSRRGSTSSTGGCATSCVAASTAPAARATASGTRWVLGSWTRRPAGWAGRCAAWDPRPTRVMPGRTCCSRAPGGCTSSRRRIAAPTSSPTTCAQTSDRWSAGT